MKKIIFLCLAFILANSVYAQSNKWSSIAYTYSKGPVAPQFQYSYTISIKNNGSGTLTYVKGTASNDYTFILNKQDRKDLNEALANSNVFSVSPADLKSDQTVVGGPTKTIVITLKHQNTIEIPDQVKTEYLEGVQDLYDVIENLVPDSIWKQAVQ